MELNEKCQKNIEDIQRLHAIFIDECQYITQNLHDILDSGSSSDEEVDLLWDHFSKDSHFEHKEVEVRIDNPIRNNLLAGGGGISNLSTFANTPTKNGNAIRRVAARTYTSSEQDEMFDKGLENQVTPGIAPNSQHKKNKR